MMMGIAEPDAAAQRLINTLFRRLIPFLFVLMVVSFLDRINIGFAGLTLSRDLGLNAAMFGLAGTLFYATYVVCGIPANMLLVRVGARRWMAILLVLWGLASSCTLFARGPWSLCLLRMLVGVTEAGFLPGMLVYLTWWFPAAHRARASALFLIAMPFTMMVGALLSGSILALDGVLNLRGWQWLFLLEGGPAVLLGAVTWFCLDDGPQQAKWLSAQEKRLLEAMLQAERTPPPAPRTGNRGWQQVLTPEVVLYALAYFCLTSANSAVNLWTPQILQSLHPHSSATGIGMLAAIPQLFTLVAMILWSRHSDRRRERRWHMLLPCLLAAGGWLLTAVSSRPALQLAGMVLASMGSFSALAIFWTTPDTAVSASSRAVALAVINGVGNIGSGVSPLFIGVMRDLTGSFSSGLLLVALLLVAGAAILWRIPMPVLPAAGEGSAQHKRM